MRVVCHTLWQNTHAFKNLLSSLKSIFFFYLWVVGSYHLNEMASDSQHGIQRCHGVLKYIGYFLAAKNPHLPFIQLRYIDFSFRDIAILTWNILIDVDVDISTRDLPGIRD